MKVTVSSRRLWPDLTPIALLLTLGAGIIASPVNAQETTHPAPIRFHSESFAKMQKLAQQQQTQAQSPEDYVMSKFRDHDIIFLGEEHQLVHNLQFLQALLPRLHAAGYGLGYEPVNSSRQAELDKLLTGKRFDEELANFLLLDTEFKYKEYRDVLHAAWELNSALPAGEPRFRILALDDSGMMAVKDWAFLRPGEKGRDPEVRERFRLSKGLRNTRDQHWAELIDREFIRKGQKALIYGGHGHTTTRFVLERRYVGHYRTVGNLIYDYIGDRTFHILLHVFSKYPSQMVEDLLGNVAGEARFGMDLQGTVLGAVPSMEDGYLPAQKRAIPEGFTLADMADGYIYLAPRAQWKITSPIKGIYDNPKNLQMVREKMRINAGDRNLEVTSQQLEQADREGGERWRKQIAGVQ